MLAVRGGGADGDLLVTLTGTGFPTITCSDPVTGNVVEREDVQEQISVTRSMLIEAAELDNTTPRIRVTIGTAPAPIVPGAPDCDSTGLIESIVDMSYSSATIDIEQGTSQASRACTIKGADDGNISKDSVSCTTS